jgi:YD repeat-containing protein
MSYSDIEFPGSKTDISRSYSSSNTNIGLFGYGWGTLMETKLYVLPEGSLYIKWWGGNGEDIFESPVTERKGVIFMINEIIKFEITADKLENSPVAIFQRKAELAGDATKRIARYIQLIEKKLVVPYTHSSTAKKIWRRNVNQAIVWDGRQYTIQNWDDQYIFNSIGLMTEVKQPDTRLKLFYTKNLLSGILVDEKHFCGISTDSSGKIKQLLYKDSAGQKQAIFTYDNNNNLLYSKDADNNEYWYRYDKAHNLVRISYTDTTFMEIDYDPATYRAIRVKEKNGAATVYQYPYFYTEDGKLNLLHYATRIKRYDSTGLLTFTEYYEYESRTKPNGEDYLYRRLAQTDTLYDEALYQADVGNAYYRKKNNKEAWAGYDNKIRCTYLHINDSVYRCSYNLLDKIDKFWQIDSLKKDSTLYQYSYDPVGKLRETKKNKILYQVKGSRQEGKIEVKKNNQELLIGFKNGIPYYIKNKEWGITLIETPSLQSRDSLDKKKSVDTLSNKTGSNSTGVNTRLANDEKSRMQSSDLAKMEQKTMAHKKTEPGMAKSSEKTNQQKLRELYEEFKDIMEPKEIAHEWIWERL